jgi:hypothetical protein
MTAIAPTSPAAKRVLAALAHPACGPVPAEAAAHHGGNRLRPRRPGGAGGEAPVPRVGAEGHGHVELRQGLRRPVEAATGIIRIARPGEAAAWIRRPGGDVSPARCRWRPRPDDVPASRRTMAETVSARGGRAGRGARPRYRGLEQKVGRGCAGPWACARAWLNQDRAPRRGGGLDPAARGTVHRDA